MVSRNWFDFSPSSAGYQTRLPLAIALFRLTMSAVNHAIMAAHVAFANAAFSGTLSFTAGDGTRLTFFLPTARGRASFEDAVARWFPSHSPTSHRVTHSPSPNESSYPAGTSLPADACEELACRLLHSVPGMSTEDWAKKARTAVVVRSGPMASSPSEQTAQPVAEEPQSGPTHQMFYLTMAKHREKPEKGGVQVRPRMISVNTPLSQFLGRDGIASISATLSSGWFRSETAPESAVAGEPCVDMREYELFAYEPYSDYNRAENFVKCLGTLRETLTGRLWSARESSAAIDNHLFQIRLDTEKVCSPVRKPVAWYARPAGSPTDTKVDITDKTDDMSLLEQALTTFTGAEWPA